METLELTLQWEKFAERHIGLQDADVCALVAELGFNALEELINTAVPKQIRSHKPLPIGKGLTETELRAELLDLGRRNRRLKSWLGMGYAACIMPAAIRRYILENPGWYTQYTPYQAEISQGRLEALFNFQTMIADLTGLELANASLLDEATAVFEAILLARRQTKSTARAFLAAESHPQVCEVVRGRCEAMGIALDCFSFTTWEPEAGYFVGVLPYPTTTGGVFDYRSLLVRCREAKVMSVMSCDLLALTLLVPPGELGADIAVGNSQRFGVPMAYGGPHAAFFACRSEYKRQVPGRIVGLSRDAEGKPAYRLALQTREQHIRRERATSNICTAQALLANIAGFYGVYHGPGGLRQIARRVHSLTLLLASGLSYLGLKLREEVFFDTVSVDLDEDRVQAVLNRAIAAGVNLRRLDHGLGVSLDETTSKADVEELWQIFGASSLPVDEVQTWLQGSPWGIPESLRRKSSYMQDQRFHVYRGELAFMRYVKSLENRDLSLTHGMIPLGSCTMKLNAAVELEALSLAEFDLHPFVPLDQAAGYQSLFRELEGMLAGLTGMAKVSLQPNSGAQGELAGLLAIRAYFTAKGESRDLCLIPASAHGTNPASAVLAGLKVEVLPCDANGQVSLDKLKAKSELYAGKVAALMVTYPSTCGIFEEQITELCDLIHSWGGQVYMDGANLNAQLGLCLPAAIGADAMHINLHKTFAIPHGGGGPGVGPLAVKEHLALYLPGHKEVNLAGIPAVSAAPWGSAGVLPISWAYIKLMGASGLQRASKVAILSANYIVRRLERAYDIMFRGPGGLVAHECIIDLRALEKQVGIRVGDVAKRLMDFGFHAPTVSFPMAGTLMIEPTESESKAELDRFCEAMLSIRDEIADIERGDVALDASPLRRAPHTVQSLTGEWDRPYSRSQALGNLENKFWPSVARVDEAYGDRNLQTRHQPHSG